MKLLLTLTTLLAAPTITHAQTIPPVLTGTWRIAKILPTKNTQCWDADRSKSLLGTTLRYAPHRLTTLAGQTAISEALSRTLSLHKFLDEYKVDLPDLGIRTPEVHEIDLQHEDADFTGATTEVPGDTVLLASPTHIVISACGVFYSAIKASR